MWKHRITIGLFIVVIITAWFLWRDYFVLISLLSLVVLGIILFLGVTQVRFNYFVTSKNKGSEGVSLTFDDGPNPETTPKILEILNKHGVKGAFFLIGKNIDGNESLVKEIISGGHIIGNHSMSHHNHLPMKGTAILLSEFEDCSHLIHSVTGKTPRLVRIPFGLSTPNYFRALKRLGLVPVGWNLRTFDTMYKSKLPLLSKSLKKLGRNSIVLFHDGNAITLEVLEDFIVEAKKTGIEFVSLDKNLKEHAYQ